MYDAPYYLGSKKLDQKVALITGGDSGIGRSVAVLFAREGADVAIVYLAEDKDAEETKSAVEKEGRRCILVKADVSERSHCHKAVMETVEKFGRIDVLVNSGGHGPRAPILEITDEQWHTGMDVYLLNVIRPVRIVAPQMVKQKGGAIINISTAWVVEPSPMFPTSAVFRAGLAAYTKIFANTYAADNVRMNNVLPGWIDSLPATEERRDSVPMQRYGTSEEIAATIAFLASEGAGYITGQNIRVDGGIIRAI
ncbi:SDR family oxidoreductase [Mesorhizobium sp. M7A.F.Ca.CA.004.02.1.1]|uniref:SDR family oxidoreductase n=8 Tax=unclassified Mesorhizobium TaxID=325217 RepID=UPI0032AFB27D